MEKFLRIFFSMKMMSVGMLAFFIAIARATFIESAYDTQTAKLIIYNAIWFEGLLAYLAICVLYNIFQYDLFRREKIASLFFHLSFIVVIIGAAITRYYGYEGMMTIREGASSNIIYSSDPFLWFKVNDGKLQYTDDRKMFLSEITDNDFSIDVNFPNHKSPVTIEYVNYRKKMIDSLVVHDSIKGYVLDIRTNGMKPNYLTKNGFIMVGGIPLSFAKKDAAQGINIFEIGGQLKMKTDFPMRYLPMTEMQRIRQTGQPAPDSLYVDVPTGKMVDFHDRMLYMVGEEQFVFKQKVEHARQMLMPSGKKNVGSDYLTVKVSDGKESRIIELEGGMGAVAEHEVFELNGLTYEMEYGSKRYETPFNVTCRDFTLERYPGSNTPSSYSSDVTLEDKRNHYKKDQKIYMNHVMDYDGYRFFQSSYDTDEKGTHLSVNHDWWGTNITYLGYLMMFVGMIMNLFAPKGRFRELTDRLKKLNDRKIALEKTLLIAVLLSTPFISSAQHSHQHTKKPVFHVISEEHSEKLARMLIQEYNGRISPYHTFCDELLRDVANKTKYKDYNAVQTVTSMHMYPEHWYNEKIIEIPALLRDELKTGPFASFKELTDHNGNFIKLAEYQKAFQKKENQRDEHDKKIIKLVDNFQVVQAVFSWQFMKIIPIKNEPNNKWFIPLSQDLMQHDTVVSKAFLAYISTVHQASIDKNYSKADELLEGFIKFQRSEAAKVVPSEGKVDLEIKYTNMHIFGNAMKMYGLLGFVLIAFGFIQIVGSPKNSKSVGFKRSFLSVLILVLITFLYQGFGIGVRWYITDHAPWSNGYEAVVFIAWVTVLSGLFFGAKRPLILGASLILSFCMIMVTEMSLMDPQMTPLQPVLKSYWLNIHVAIITGSYGFLGLACILGLVNLVLYIIRNPKNGQRLSISISEITYISEMTMTVGLFMLTIGTFLGGIWANESWGRYWGWDPKEVWALASIIVYAIILHFRFIPFLSGKFVFNAFSFWGYGAILFTFFGVNYYLVGLHSYAQGDSTAKVPSWIYYTIFFFIILTIVSIVRNVNYKKAVEQAALSDF